MGARDDQAGDISGRETGATVTNNQEVTKDQNQDGCRSSKGDETISIVKSQFYVDRAGKGWKVTASNLYRLPER